MIRSGLRLFAAIAALCASASSGAQSFPSKPIRVIVPISVGGILDVVARGVTGAMRDGLGQPVIVENRPGAGTITGMSSCAKAAPDGYTLCITNSGSLSFGPHLFSSLPYDADADFVPIANIGLSNMVIAANAAAPFNDYKELVAYAKSKPGALNWATWGAASLPDLYLRWIEHYAGIRIVAIPFNGAAQATPSVIAGESHITAMGISNAMALLKSGKIKPLVAVGTERLRHMPSLPALGEYGADPGLRNFIGAYAPANTPRPIVNRLNAEINKGLTNPQVVELFRRVALEPPGANTPEDFALLCKVDRDNAGKAFRLIGITPQSQPQ